MAVCLNISTVINIKILTNSNQQTQSYKLTSHIAAFLSVVLITEMLEICIQTSYHQNVQLILKSTEMFRFMFSRTWLLNEISGIEFKPSLLKTKTDNIKKNHLISKHFLICLYVRLWCNTALSGKGQAYMQLIYCTFIVTFDFIYDYFTIR